jgi:hypothetical protein
MNTRRIVQVGVVGVAAGLIAGCLCRGPDVKVSGAEPAKDFDLQAFLDHALQSGAKKVVVPPGRYRVKPQRAQHLVLKGWKDVAIIADGAEMICTETSRALTLSGCTNVTVRGLTIDYDPLPFTQGRIVRLSEDKKVHEVELFDGYPAADKVDGSKYEIFRPDTRTLRCPDYSYTAEKVDAKHLRIVKRRSSVHDLEQVGDIVVIGATDAPGGRSAHAVVVESCQNVQLERVTLYASNCFGFLEYDCDGTTYKRCVLDRRPPESDPVLRADPRIRSANADAFHSKYAVRGPRLLSCVARFQGDDGLNICGDYHLVMACQGRVLRVLAKHRMNIEPGDPVELVSYDGRRLPDAKALTVTRDDAITEAERAFLLKQRMDEGVRTRACTEAYTVTLDRELALPVGSVIASQRRVGSGFLVKGCEFGYNRSRGILIKGSRGEVAGNTLVGSRMAAVLVTPEYWWLEAGSASDVVIRDNVISECGRTAIEVSAHDARGQVAPAGAHSRIRIESNRISSSPLPAIAVTSTDQLTIKDNRVLSPSGGTGGAVSTNGCLAVTVRNNSVR